VSDLIWFRRRRCAGWALFSAVARPRVDDRRIVSGIMFVIRNGLHARDVKAPRPLSALSTATLSRRFFAEWSRPGSHRCAPAPPWGRARSARGIVHHARASSEYPIRQCSEFIGTAVEKWLAQSAPRRFIPSSLGSYSHGGFPKRL